MHSYLLMILNVSNQLNHQMMLPNYKMTLMPYPPGATLQISYLTSLNLFTFGFGKSQQPKFQHTLSMINQLIC